VVVMGKVDDDRTKYSFFPFIDPGKRQTRRKQLCCNSGI
jgi:hypothetical protein